MKRSMLRMAVAGVSVVLVGALLGVGGCAHQPKTPEERMALSTKLLEPLPSPARLALERLTDGQGVTALTTDEFEGRDVYTADYLTSDGMKAHAQVTSDGRVLSQYVETKTLKFDDVPEVVKTAIRSRTGGAKVETVMVERQGMGAEGDAANHYSAKVDLSGTKHKYTFDYTGALVSEATQVRADQLPPSAGATLDNRFPGILKGMIWEVRDSKGGVTYAADGWSKGRKVRAVSTAAGVIKSVSYTAD